ncbi:MAG: pilus assembly protein [Actinobacteria bacterium]|nr:pilus assembly protein [Actinomycetota bacterium]MBV8960178.1 pilus assembly protein [Actinomycetota bacterium]MBV9253672.1 pilus assembly protein [Actinomycetota bacterium]MBV9665614.1 pilus assembly protein [Actinomycetota bacterium]MBV9933374.1 pilus assembly protein [Actinomycetota bacterium]
MALVEFALVLPFLAMLVFGAIDLGRAFALRNELTNAAREGGRFAQFFPQQVEDDSSSGSDCYKPNSITYAATNEQASVSSNFTVSVSRLDTNAVIPATTCVDPPTIVPGTHIKVSVSAPFRVLTPIVSRLTGQTITLTRSVEVVVQG